MSLWESPDAQCQLKMETLCGLDRLLMGWHHELYWQSIQSVPTCSCRVRQQRNSCECRAALHTLVVASLPQATGDMESQLSDADS